MVIVLRSSSPQDARVQEDRFVPHRVVSPQRHGIAPARLGKRSALLRSASA